MDQILFCSDLDRTILPNGPQSESTAARPLLRMLSARPEVVLVYVSGRNRQLLQQAIEQYDIPVPDYAVGDVGTTIYAIESGQWIASRSWQERIAPDWHGTSHQKLAEILAVLKPLKLQEPEKQNTFKLSYYLNPTEDIATLVTAAEKILLRAQIKATIIWSIDETENIGLFDVLPASATKLHAVRFLMEHLKMPTSRTVFAGDSGNDLPVLVSDLQAVLVKNATDEVRQEALKLAKQNGALHNLYLAQGNFLGMNGNYSAGALEGLAHYLPELADFFAQALKNQQ